ncbi:MAG: hypothetical protein R3B48_28865 [Kofleriaceae bacterium]
MLLRVALLVSLGTSIIARGQAEACIQALEADAVVGWSADGRYALYTRTDDKKLDHAEILPTAYRGYIYTISADEEEGTIVVVRSEVGECAQWSEDPGVIVEKKKGKLTTKSLMALKTVKAMKFGRATAATAAAAAGAPTAAPAAAAGTPATALFTGKKRYETHNVEITMGTSKLELPLPVFCVGSCLADEDWQKWSITVDGVHELPDGTKLFELTMPKVCNGGTIHRVITQTPPKIKVPKRRCTGSG